jgi:hypothetical protein
MASNFAFGAVWRSAGGDSVPFEWLTDQSIDPLEANKEP